jgi:hypothetical protein
MASWSVQPDGVWEVTNKVIEAALPMFDALDGLEAQLIAAINGTQSAAVNDAVAAFIDTASDEVTLIRGRVPGAVTGAREATNALTLGDAEMAAHIQSQAVQTGTTPPTGVF